MKRQNLIKEMVKVLEKEITREEDIRPLEMSCVLVGNATLIYFNGKEFFCREVIDPIDSQIIYLQSYNWFFRKNNIQKVLVLRISDYDVMPCIEAIH